MIDAVYAEQKSFVENPEWLEVTLDSKKRILEGITKNGIKKINVPLDGLSLTEEGMSKLVHDLEEHGISGGGISKEDADVRYAVKSIEGTVSQNTQDLEAIEASIATNLPVVVALRNELDGVEARVDAIEQAGGLTPPNLNLYKKISSELTITQAELNSWEGHVVEVIADIILSGDTNFSIPQNCVIYMNGGRFVLTNYTGTLTTNKAFIKADPYKVFEYTLSYNNTKLFSDSFRTDISYGEWFGAVGNGVHFDAICFQLTHDNIDSNEIHLLPNKTYLFENTFCMRDVVIRGAKTSKIIRQPIFIDLPILTDMTTATADNDGVYTLTVDTESEYYSLLRVGMGVNFRNSGPGWTNDFVTWTGYYVCEINGSQVKLKGEVLSASKRAFKYNDTFSAWGPCDYDYTISNQVPLVMLEGTCGVYNVHFDGALSSFPVREGRVSWWATATLSTSYVAEVQKCNHINVEDCVIENSVSDGICLGGGTSIRVCHNRIVHCGANGLHFGNVHALLIEDNYIFDTNINEGRVIGVYNNRGYNNGTGHNEGGITYSSCLYNVTIVNNTIEHCLTGIGGIGTADNCKSIFANNTILSFRTSGIDIRLAEVKANGTSYSSTWGDRFREFIINSNRIIASHEVIGGTNAQNKEHTITEEPIYDGVGSIERQPYAREYGIRIFIEHLNTSIVGDDDTSEDIDDEYGPYGSSVDIYVEGLIISNNLFKDCGISITHANDAVVSNNSIFMRYNDYPAGSVHPKHILYIGDLSNVNLIGNIIRNFTNTYLTDIICKKGSGVTNISNNMYSTIDDNNCVFIEDSQNTGTILNTNNINLNQ